MQIPVLIEPINGNGYRAKSGEPLALCVEAATREDAIAKFKKQVQSRLSKGAEIVNLEVTPEPHPLAEFAGMFKDDPYFEEVLEIMAENRRKMDRVPRAS